MKLADTGLRRQPFRTHGTPLVMVPYASHEAAVRFLNTTRHENHGLNLFHGPPLSGKTSIIREFTASLPVDFAFALVDSAGIEADTMLRYILSQFGYERGFNSTSERFGMIKVFAMQQAANDCAPLLIIENAHAMSPIALEMLCELADLTVNGKSALRIILVSDRPMMPIIRAPAMQTISNRVTGKFLLQPLTRKETTQYIHAKLMSGGCDKPQVVVPPPVCDRLHTVSGGWPGMIDQLTLMALSKADRCPLRIEHIPRQPPPVRAPPLLTKPATLAAKRKSARTQNSAPQLILTHRGNTLERIVLDKPRFIIGRNEPSDLIVIDDWISRYHAALFRTGGTTIIVDLKSKNGTFVNGERVLRQVLINNDIVSIGDHRIKFMDPAATRRTKLRGAQWDETTISRSVEKFRAVIAGQLRTKKAG